MGRPTAAFTLIEIMLIVAAIAILAGATVLAINPTRHLEDVRNGQRKIDVATIWSAIQQYRLDTHGSVPSSISSGTLSQCTTEVFNDQFAICKTTGCSVMLDELTTDGKYLSEVPIDPSAESELYSGYNVILDEDRQNKVVVCAPSAEGGEVIYVER
jgi:type II secretory pathway pseudopilin PulG